MAHKVEIRESKARHVLQTKPNYDVLLNGVKVDRAYFNMTGYRVGLPLPDGRMLDPGEISLTQLRREVARINREAKAAAKA